MNGSRCELCTTGVSAQPGCLAFTRRELLATVAVATQQHDVGSEVRERTCDFEADAGVGAGHETAAPREIHVQIRRLEAQRMDLEAGAIEGR